MLTAQHIKDFRRDGYVVVKGLYSGRELDDLTAWADEVAAYPEVPGKYMMYFEDSLLEPGKRLLSRMEDIEPYHAGFSRLFNGDKMLGAVSDLFGEPAILFKDKINFKMPGASGFRAHQDIQAGWDSYARLHITALISIDASTDENGCLEIAPGHHRQGLLGEKWKPLDEDSLPYIQIPTAPGDAMFFDSFAPHRSGPNNTVTMRRVLYITYNRLSEGDHRRDYYRDKRKSYPPDCERDANKDYSFRV